MSTGENLLGALLDARGRSARLTHVEHLPGREGEHDEWPDWADPALVAGYRDLGVSLPWRHQVEAADAAWAGRHTVLATSTGSGKSLAYWLPALTAVRADAVAGLLDPGRIESTVRRGSVLYLSPTKALAADQRASLETLLTAADARDIRVATCDGDTPFAERRWVRDHADVVLTNPDYLHFALLPQHRRWARLLANLRYVVIDECHAYRGLFGAHVALVLRRLRRLADHYAGSARVRRTGAPGVTFVLASATTADPAESAARLVGVAPEDVVAVTRDTSRAGRKTFALWQPPALPGFSPFADGASPDDGELRPPEDDPWALPDLGARDASGEPTPTVDDDAASGARPTDAALILEPEPGSSPAGGPDVGAEPDGLEHARRTATAEAADLVTDLVVAGARALVFTRSRHGAESVADRAREHLREVGPRLGDQVAAYRGGYLPEERRALEKAIRDGTLRALATTNALELGMDISGLDAVVIAGWPGTRVSLWQQAGRAGRRGADGLVVLVAREDPLDQYVVNHPETVFDTPVEATVFDPANPYVLAPHLCAAAAELPLRSAELDTFGAHTRELLDVLVARGALRQRPSGWYWTPEESAAHLTDLRGTGGSPVQVVEAGTGRVLGTVDAANADQTVHPGAVYVHQGVRFVVDALVADDGVALVTREDVPYGTWARWITSTAVKGVDESVAWGPLTLSLGTVEVSTQVVGYDKRRLPDLQLMASEPLDMPPRTLTTKSVWWTAPPEVLAAAGLTAEQVPGALHAAEHASIGLLPLLATCDRWDLGGVSTAVHADTEQATVFVHDAFPGGAGFSERGFRLGATWLRATRDVIAGCACHDGCPACVQSPKCGNANHPLEKAAAVRLLDAVLAHAPH